MEIIVSYLQQGLLFIIPLVILLGLLIFVHELGHFLVAKYYGVRVEVFSLGFGKKLFSKRVGDTDYCLSIIPFGGYVKMYGDDPTVEVPADQKRYSFTHKPVGQRIAVVLAGPLMNLFFAIFLFFLIAIVGEEILRPVVGDISLASKAYEYGLRSNDNIIKVNNQPVTSWPEVKEQVEKNGSGPIQITVQRGEEKQTLTAQTSLTQNPNILSSQEYVGDIDGLTYLFRSSAVAVTGSKSLASQNGLKTRDIITEVNGKSVATWSELITTIESQRNSDVLNLKVDRLVDEKSTPLEVKIPITDIKAVGDIAAALGIDQPDLYVTQVVPDSAAQKAGLLPGDKIVGVNGPITDWSQMVKRVQNFKEKDLPLNMSIIRDGQTLELQMSPKKVTQTAPTGKEFEVYAIGVMAGVVNAPPSTFLYKAANPGAALGQGVRDSWLWTKNTVLSFVRLIQNKVSAKSIGGPIMIGQLASKTFQVGLSPFLKIMAIISINLFILNLLPVPVLDGGHLVFFSIEALRGAPLSMRKMEIAQQIGLFILMGLMVLALFNDVSRLFE